MAPTAVDAGTLDTLRSSVGDDPRFFAELIDDFLVEGPTQLEVARGALATGDAELARRAVHTLKGQSRMFGALDLASLCQDAEAEAAVGDVAAVSVRLDGIAAELDRARVELLAARERA